MTPIFCAISASRLSLRKDADMLVGGMAMKKPAKASSHAGWGRNDGPMWRGSDEKECVRIEKFLSTFEK
jgi:hypothetical protein